MKVYIDHVDLCKRKFIGGFEPDLPIRIDFIHWASYRITPSDFGRTKCRVHAKRKETIMYLNRFPPAQRPWARLRGNVSDATRADALDLIGTLSSRGTAQLRALTAWLLELDEHQDLPWLLLANGGHWDVWEATLRILGQAPARVPADLVITAAQQAVEAVLTNPADAHLVRIVAAVLDLAPLIEEFPIELAIQLYASPEPALRIVAVSTFWAFDRLAELEVALSDEHPEVRCRGD